MPTLRERLDMPRCLNPFEDDYLWYLSVKEDRPSKNHTGLIPKEKKALRNKAIVFLSRYGFSREQVSTLFDIGTSMVSTIVAADPEVGSFASKYHKLNKETSYEMRLQWASGRFTRKELAKMYNVAPCTVTNILNNKRWKTG
jgi:hypothetical protein